MTSEIKTRMPFATRLKPIGLSFRAWGNRNLGCMDDNRNGAAGPTHGLMGLTVPVAILKQTIVGRKSDFNPVLIAVIEA